MKPYFGRLITAMITFFHEDGSLNAEGTAEFASWLVDHGSDAILVAGTSGEAPTLTYDEKKELFTAVIKKLDGRAPVIVGTGSNDTAQTLNMNKLAEEVAPTAFLLLVLFITSLPRKDSISISRRLLNIPNYLSWSTMFLAAQEPISNRLPWPGLSKIVPISWVSRKLPETYPK